MRFGLVLLLPLVFACARSRSDGQVKPDPATVTSKPALAEHPDVTLASSSAEAPLPNGVKVFVGRNGLSLNPAGPPLLKTASDPTKGYPEEGKKNVLTLGPLADALPSGSRAAIVFVDRATTYRMLVEVLFTLGQNGLGEMTLVVRNGAREVGIPLTLPKVGKHGLEGPQLSILLVNGGFSVKTSLGNLAPGCKTIGAGVAVPEVEGKPDLPGLRACVGGVKSLDAGAPWTDVGTFVASADRTFQDLVDMLDAVRPELPNVMLGVPR